MLGPNITGLAGSLLGAGDGAVGVFAQTQLLAENTRYTVGSNGFRGQLIFNAHDSKAIYTDSGKVYPLSLALNYILKL